MKKNKLSMLLLGILFSYLPLQSMAWGMLGHRVVGQIADSYLTKKARKNIELILGGESVAMASTWGDFIKADPAYNYLSPWHYIDFDKPYSYPEMQAFLKQDTAVDAYTKLNLIIAQLKNKNLEQDKKLLYLRMLIHIVGDVHQPMHTAHTEDKGGNDVKLFWFNKPTNLHALWDSEMIDDEQLSYTEYANWINRSTKEQRDALQHDNISKWLYESSQISEKLYAELKPNVHLSYRYTFDHIAIANQQLLKGGIRLAGILNQLFG
ncbi:S1/P1 nuclease [Mucilaginibacter arboris]|uniref:S1/P1 Nuclease n=1 Tax=Mucilaginibacter arboris TaxID=2682090 RepID=A0A7K1SSS2_9SPHI|nr:S1/P1 nuclease [Mucilaginibacter arboris]MVN20150.1 S1/P1 Nuclease [Mucilaginibacter arboris]